MDPQVNIEQQRAYARQLLALTDRDTRTEQEQAEMNHLAGELAQLVLDLDEFRRRDGYDPYRVRS